MAIRTRSIGASSRAWLAAVALGAAAASDAGVYVHSVEPVEGVPGTVNVWTRIDWTMSVECSPPRACYAKSQWILARINCWSRSLQLIEQHSYDLNGNVVAVARAADGTLVPPYGPGADVIFHQLCGWPADVDEYRPSRRVRHPPK